MDDYFVESVRVKKKHDFDVIVAGGGIAGCAAAISAARSGVKVLLIEKLISLGGLATNGLVVLYFPSLCTSAGQKVTGGLAEELLHTSIEYGFNTLNSAWSYGKKQIESGAQYTTMFSAPSFIVALDEAMESAGVEVLFDSVCVGLSMNNGICQGVIVENKEGRVYYGCKQLVDTTGDLDLIHRAGAECRENMKNWLSFWAQTITMDKIKKATETGDVRNAVHYAELGVGMYGKNYDRSQERIAREYTIESGEEVSSFIKDGRKFLHNKLKMMDPNNEIVMAIPSQADFRMTRQLVGNYTLTDLDINRHFDDSIGCLRGTLYVDSTMTGREVSEDEYILEVPYRTLITRSLGNILTAGRSISSTGNVSDLTRLIGSSALTGQAAGTAAALCAKRACNVNTLNISDLQNALSQADVMIHH